jgi:transcriptional regulator with AAA-type ATPase domain/polyferredoxin
MSSAPMVGRAGGQQDAGADPARLEVVLGRTTGRQYLLGARTTIGRGSGCGIVLESDPEVSRQHAEILCEGGRYRIRDIGSRNGIRTDEGVLREAWLAEGQRFTIGRTELLFRAGATEVPLEARLALLEGCALLRALAAEDKRALAGQMLVRFHPAGAVILAQRQPLSAMFFLRQGRIRVVTINDAGAERLVTQLAPGASYGERVLVAGGELGETLIADSDSVVLELPRDRFDSVLAKRPAAGETLHLVIADRLRAAQAQAASAAPADDAVERGARRSDSLQDLVVSTDVEVVGEDPKIVQARRKIEGWAKDDGAVLICGPQGSGKKLLARYCHKLSARVQQPYVELSLADQEPGRLTAALFGEESDEAGGRGRVGYLELMGSGTLALVHAERLDAYQQMMLATYLKRGYFQRAFGQQRINSKTRILLVATGTEAGLLESLIPELREQVGKRTVAVPALANRAGDIPRLAAHMLKRASAKAGKRIPDFTREAIERLVSYAWPGNVEELKEVVKRAVVVADAEQPIPVGLIFVVPPEKEAYRINLLRRERFRSVLRHPALTTTLGLLNTAFVGFVFLLTAYGGLQAADHPLAQADLNPGMWLTWRVWFVALPISALLLGRAWCAMCPIIFSAELVAKVVRLNLPVPKLFKALDFWLLLGVFLLVDSCEDVFGIPDKPLATALFLVLVIGGAAFITVLFERRVFCRYLCPLSGWLGAYSTISVLEVRGNKKVCQTQCGEHTCYKGTDKVPGCPMFLYPASMTSNAECMLCVNCVKSCENRGVRLNLRPPLQELWQSQDARVGLGVLAVALVSVMLRHQFALLPWWSAMREAGQWPGFIVDPALVMLFLGVVLGAFLISAVLSAAVAGERLGPNVARFGLAFVPLALAGHIAHLTHEWLPEGLNVIAGYFVQLARSLFRGIPIGSQPVAPVFPVAASAVTLLKLEIVALGILGSAIAVVKIARKGGTREAIAQALPHLLLLFALSAAYLYVFLAS